MNRQEVELRVKETMAKVFNLEVTAINQDSSPDQIPAWDSLGQMNLIMALEEEFAISFSDQQSIELRNFELTVVVVLEALKS